jgi:mono/diheme cytochrome c family protein
LVTAGDPVAGKDIASRRCAQCHLVDGSRTKSAAPPLPVIARDVSWTDDRLADFLTKSHGGMRGFSISQQKIDNLVAYIRSLEPH